MKDECPRQSSLSLARCCPRLLPTAGTHRCADSDYEVRRAFARADRSARCKCGPEHPQASEREMARKSVGFGSRSRLPRGSQPFSLRLRCSDHPIAVLSMDGHGAHAQDVRNGQVPLDFAGGNEEADDHYEDAARRHNARAIPAKKNDAHGDFATLSPSASMIARYALSWFSR
jgi:hypothetical protein